MKQTSEVPDYMLDVQLPQGGAVIPVVPLNIVALRPLHRRLIDHVPSCTAPCCIGDDDRDGNCPRHQPGSGGFRNKPIEPDCEARGCITELAPWCEVLLVNTAGQDSSLRTETPTEVLRAELNAKLHLFAQAVVAQAASQVKPE